MKGQWVVTGLIALTAGTAGLFWAVGLDTVRRVEAQEEALGVPRLSPDEAARRVAQEDMFGLPSRLADAPDRDVERAFKVGTPEAPLAADAAGIATMFEAYAVTIKGCRSQLPPEARAAKALAVYVTLQTVEGVGRVVAVDGIGEGTATRAFTTCVAGGVRPAVFVPPLAGQQTTSHQLVWP